MLRLASRSTLRRSFLVLLSVGLAACGGGDGGPTGPAAVAEVDVSPPQATITVGDTQPFTAVVRDANGGVLTGRTVTWGVQSTSVATINSGSGVALGVGEGTTMVTATVEGVPGTAELTVELGDFAPGSNTSISGNRTFASVNIPAGVTVTVTGPVVITVAGDVMINGTFTGDCDAIEFRVDGDFVLDGLISNLCSSDPGGAGGNVTIVADGDMTIGSAAADDDAIVSDGTIFLTDSATEDENLDPIFDADASPSAATPRAGPARAAGGGNTGVNRPVRAMRGGSEVRLARTGDVFINGDIEAADGMNAAAESEAPNCVNTNIGGTGGSVRLAAPGGTLTIGVGVFLTAGDGGKGGDCTAEAPAGQAATATSGQGGNGGSVLVGGNEVQFQGGVTVERGNGGQGGDAIAVGGDGVAPCEDGYSGTATGGIGGRAGGVGYIINSPNTIGGAPTEAGANGGKGGYAEATGGNGTDCVCGMDDGAGGDGGPATANGGNGGDGAKGKIWQLGADSHKKGEGGDADALGGDGGHGADCCGQDAAGGDGGAGGAATATGGQMGTRGIGGDSQRGDADSFGGNGGDGGDGVGAGGAGGTGGIATSDGHDPTEDDGTDGDPGALCPQLFGASLFTAINTPVIVHLQFIDAQGDLPDLATLMIIGLDASEGTISDVQITDVMPPLDGVYVTLTFTPADGFEGMADFEAKIQDVNGDQSNLAPVTINVAGALQLFELLTAGVNLTPGVHSLLALLHLASSQMAGTMDVVGSGAVFQDQSNNPGPRLGLGMSGAWFFDLYSLFIDGDPDASVAQAQICFVNFLSLNPLVRIYLYADDGSPTPPASPAAADAPVVNRQFEVTQEGCGDFQIGPEDRWLVIQSINQGSIDFLNPHILIRTDREFTMSLPG